MVRRVLIVLLLIPVPASAAVKFATGFEWGTTWPATTGGTQTLFDSASATAPTIIAIDSGGDLRCDYESANYGAICTTNTDCGSATNAFASCMTMTDNDFEMRLQPGAAVQNYVTIGSTYLSTGTDPLNLHFALNVKTIPAAAAVYEIAEIYDDAATDNRMGILQIYATSTSEYELRYYPADPSSQQSPVHSECSGGTNPGIRCTSCASNTDCDAGGTVECFNPGTNQGACEDECTADTPGEQWCLPAYSASATALQTGRRYEVALSFENTPGSDAAQGEWGMYLGGYERGSAILDKGFCASFTNESCSANSDCTGGACVNGIEDADTIRIGQAANASGTWDIRVDDILVSNDTALSTIAGIRVQDLVPATSTNVDSFDVVGASVCGVTCASGATEFDCINEANCAPGIALTDYVQNPTGTAQRDDWYALTDVTASPTDATAVLAVTAIAVMADENDNLDGTDQLGGAIVSTIAGAETSAGASETKVERTLDVNQDETPTPGGYSLLDDDDYDLTSEVNAAAVKLQSGPGCTQSCQMNFYTASVEAYVAQTLGVLPGIAADVNEDGERALCIAGDSTIDQTGIRNLVLAGLKDFSSIMFCTMGGTTVGDVGEDIQDILDGEPGGTMNCRYMKGSDNPCDYLFVVNGHNSNDNGDGLHPRKYCKSGTTPGLSCSANSDCAGSGICAYYSQGFCKGGTRDGYPCSCPSPRPNRQRINYCINEGSPNVTHLSSTNLDNCSVCTDNNNSATEVPSAHCIPGDLCSANSDCGTTSVCDAGIGLCSIPGVLWTSDLCSTNDDCYQPQCVSGKCRVGCENGRCLDSFFSPVLGGLIPPPRPGLTSRWSFPGCPDTADCPDGLCWSRPTLAETERQFHLITEEVNSRTGTGGSCTTDCAVKLVIGFQPAGPELNGFGTDNLTDNANDAYGAYLRDYALREKLMFVDLNRAFRVSSAKDSNYSDVIHWSSTGYETAYDLVEDCFLNASGPADGICTAGACTSGSIGDPCDEDKDCALYQCDLLNPDWKGAMQMFYGADTYCVSGTDPFDDCSTNADCSGGTCTGSYLGDRSGRGQTLSTSGTVANAATELSLGTGLFNLTAADPGYVFYNVPSGWLGTATSVSWGGWFEFANTSTTTGNLIKTQPTLGTTTAAADALTNGFALVLANPATADPDVRCHVFDTSTTDSITGTAWNPTTGWHHLACVFDTANNTLTAYLDGVASGSPTAVTTNFSGTDPGNFLINSTSSSRDPSMNVDEAFVTFKALDATRISRIISGSIPGDFVDCDSFSASLFTACNANSDCGTTQICDTGAGALNDTFCIEGSSAGCCMGFNSARAGGAAMTACNAIP